MGATDMGIPVPAVERSPTKRRGGFLESYFYFAMALLIPAVVVFGFSFTIGRNLIHPAIPRPLILYVPCGGIFGMALVFPVAVRAGANAQRDRTPFNRLVWSRIWRVDSRGWCGNGDRDGGGLIFASCTRTMWRWT
jgi:hypothetical protein